MIPILASVVSMLAGKGLDLISSAINGGADKAVEFIEEKTGIKMDGSKLNDEQIAKLRELEVSSKIELEKLALENKKEDNRSSEAKTKLLLDDKAGARGMYVETTKATGRRDPAVVALAIVIVFGFFAGLISLVFVHLDKGSGAYELLYMAFGALTMKFGTVVDFFFGASDHNSNP